MNSTQKQVVLIIFDGWGIREETEGNAIAAANKPFYDSLIAKYPHNLLKASGQAVGLDEGEMGNSEVGHLTIGAGYAIDTDVVRISKAIADKQLSQVPAIKQAIEHVKKNNSVLHLNGLLSPGGVHSHQEHLFALLQIAKDAGLKKVAIHVFTDGRDTPPQSAKEYLEKLEKVIEQIGIGFIASVSGRYFAMDRDNNWDRLQKVESALFKAEGEQCFIKKPSEVVAELYKQGKVDEQLEPLIFCDDQGKTTPINKNDSVIFFNFRADRARMLSSKIADKSKTDNLCFVTMTEHDENINCLVAFPPIKIVNNLSDRISQAGLTQAHIAETEKYAHVTYFLNGGREKEAEGEKFFLINSRKDVPTHDLAPEMKAKEIAEMAAEKINEGFNFIVLNFANPDMVGHTANFPATVAAIEAVDQALKIVVEAALAKQAVVLITSDHGNAELEFDSKTNQKVTSHTTNPVPVILTKEGVHLDAGTLQDVAPTILDLFGLEEPAQMTGHSLIKS